MTSSVPEPVPPPPETPSRKSRAPPLPANCIISARRTAPRIRAHRISIRAHRISIRAHRIATCTGSAMADKYRTPLRDESGREDPVKPILARAQRAREAAVAVAETLLLQEKIKECYRREGINHYRNCIELTKAYMKKIQRPMFKEGPVEMEDIE